MWPKNFMSELYNSDKSDIDRFCLRRDETGRDSLPTSNNINRTTPVKESCNNKYINLTSERWKQTLRTGIELTREGLSHYSFSSNPKSTRLTYLKDNLGLNTQNTNKRQREHLSPRVFLRNVTHMAKNLIINKFYTLKFFVKYLYTECLICIITHYFLKTKCLDELIPFKSYLHGSRK